MQALRSSLSLKPAQVSAASRRLLSSSTKGNTATLILIRHGQSTWNESNQFTGWADVSLTAKGEKEAKEAGRLLKEGKYDFGFVYTSMLSRAINTTNIVLNEMGKNYVPVVKDWRLNERHYGALQGLNKAETQEKYGEAKTMEWRRSYAIPPPAVTKDSEHYPGNDPRYAKVDRALLPLTESLATTKVRVLEYWNSTIAPHLKSGNENIVICAHGNSLRALIMHLDAISEKDIIGINIPTAIPLVYTIDKSTLLPIKDPNATAPLQGKYLGDAAAVAAASHAVANQTKAKGKL